MENLLKTNKHTVCCLGGKTKPTNCDCIGLGALLTKKRERKFFFFFVMLKQIPNLWLSVSLSFVHKIEFIFWKEKKKDWI